jgi:two-component system, OmpR family, sensor histidine kinase SaeS
VIGFGFAVVAVTLGIGLVATLALTLLPTARLQLTAFALVAVLLPIWIVFFTGWAMFHMGDDVKILAVASAAASAAAAVALVIGTSLARRIERLRTASARLAAGDLTARAPESGPRELADLGRAFNEMASSIESLFDARRELVAAASHDLRTPIASITAMLEAIEDGLADASEYLVPLQDQARRLGSLVEDLFELARIDAGSLAHELHEIRLEPLVESCVRGFEAEARARNVTLERHFDGVPAARCAPEQVERVLLNLLTNALRHTPSDGTVAVVLAAGGGEVRVSVEDTGEGITAETARRMFDRFWRGDTARSADGGGAGLGLAIARGLVEAQGGRIWAEPCENGGARVSFTLPAATAG